MTFLVASCATPSPESIYGAVYPTQGAQGPGGIEEYRGVQLAAELTSVKLDLEVVERAEQASAAIDALANRGRKIVLGSYGSTISAAASAVAHRREMFFFETGAVGELSEINGLNKSTFRATSDGAALGANAISFVDDVLAPRMEITDPTFAVVYVDDVYGRRVGGGAQQTLGERTILTIPYELKTANYGDIANQIATADPDGLFVVAYLEDGVALQRELNKIEALPPIAIGTSSSYCMREFGKLLGDDAVGLFASDKPNSMIVGSETLSGEASEALDWATKTYRERYDDDLTAPALAGFAGAWALFAKIAPEASGFDSKSFALAAQNININRGELPNGSGLRFVDGSNAEAASVIWEWVAPNQREIVWPKEFATHDVVFRSESPTRTKQQ